MKIRLLITFFLLVPVVSNGLTKEENRKIEGTYNWIDNNENQVFTVSIKKFKDKYVGDYCATFYSGKIIDCSLQGESSFEFNSPLKGNTVIVDYLSYYTLSKGKLKLTFKENELLWELIKKPEGLIYLPIKAVLIRERD